jgi:hypothetical protein
MPFYTDLEVEYVDGDNWLLVAPLSYDDVKLNKGVIVPAGFVTDFASVPRGLWNFFPKAGPCAPAAVVHDFMYRFAIYDKATADLMFLHAMEDLKIGWISRQLIYRAVRVFGNGAY